MNRFLLLSLIFIASVFSIFLFFPPRKVTLIVDNVPTNTPQGAAIFVAGNFNFWDPGDGNFKLETDYLGKYWIDLPLSWGGLAYKFTRGDWTTVEGDDCGHEIANRWSSHGFGWEKFYSHETIHHQVKSWQDVGPVNCEKVIIRLGKLPRETPPGQPIYLAGSFNNWQPNHPNYRFKKAENGTYYFAINKTDHEIEYKITRGSWDAEEVNENGDRMMNRKFVFGRRDTIDLEVAGWLDIKPGLEARKVTIIVSTPPGTPPEDPVFIVGNFNGWKPGDQSYKMKRLRPHQFAITMEKPAGEMEFKFTRGLWGKEEMDDFGNHISNRKLRSSADTIRLQVSQWRDVPRSKGSQEFSDDFEKGLEMESNLNFPGVEGEENVSFKITNKEEKTVKLYVRLVLPSAPFNRNYGFIAHLQPKESYLFSCPWGTQIIACDGKYWGDFRPKETPVLKVSRGRKRIALEASQLIWREKMSPLSMDKLADW